MKNEEWLRKPRGEPSLLELSQGVASNRRSQLRVYNLTQRHKGTKFFFRNKDNKRLKSRHKALRVDNFVAFVKVALAALCIFRSRKKHSVFVPLCLK